MRGSQPPHGQFSESRGNTSGWHTARETLSVSNKLPDRFRRCICNGGRWTGTIDSQDQSIPNLTLRNGDRDSYEKSDLDVRTISYDQVSQPNNSEY